MANLDDIAVDELAVDEIAVDEIAVDEIAVVGAGECGARSVAELRRRGFDGSITLIGDELLPPYERPPLSKVALTSLDDPDPVVVAPSEQLAELGVDFIAGVAVTEIDRAAGKLVLADGRRLSYDRMLLATGARPRTLPLEGFEHARLLRTFQDAIRLRDGLRADAHVAVIGAGFIGLEVAASARQRGCEVTVIDVAPGPMGRIVPSDIAGVIAERHRREGVRLRFGSQISRIVVSGDTFGVELRGDAGRDEVVEADLVVAGVGAIPNVELAAAAGLEIDDGIAVDAGLRTSDPAILAAGDCCSVPHPLYDGRRIRLEAWRNAHDQAAVAAANLLGEAVEHSAVPWFWSDQYDLGLQIAGLPDAAATEIARHRTDGTIVRFGLDADGRIVAAGGVAPGTGIAKDIRIAEMMIAARLRPAPHLLADPSVPLKQVLKS